MSKSILVVGAHADDEVLGCGGTIAKHVAEGDLVNVIFMADGVGSRLQSDQDEFQDRSRARDEALRCLGVARQHSLDFPDNRMDSIPLLEIVQKLEPFIEEIRPTIVYTHHHGDLNIDHRLTHAAVMTVCRPMPGSSVSEIYGFEVVSSTEWATSQESSFLPNCFVDISQYLRVKLEALEAYAVEMRKVPHSRSMEHVEILAHHRGYSVGVDAAEAFEVYRIIC
jgi:LmbE family N-acetylglucosaminyl deacetylase